MKRYIKSEYSGGITSLVDRLAREYKRDLINEYYTLKEIYSIIEEEYGKAVADAVEVELCDI